MNPASSDSTAPHEKFYTLVLSSAEDQTGVELKATEDDTQLFLVCIGDGTFIPSSYY